MRLSVKPCSAAGFATGATGAGASMRVVSAAICCARAATWLVSAT